MSTLLREHPDGWRLYVCGNEQYPGFMICQLRLTRPQALAIFGRRDRDLYFSGDYRGTSPWPHMVSLTWAEGVAIWRGADPAETLLPPLYARALTLREMMSA